MKTTFVFLSFSLTFGVCFSQEFEGVVNAVVDGNTINVMDTRNEFFAIVLAGIDAPELPQPYGEEAQRALSKQVHGKSVRIILQGKDRKGNHLALVFINQNEDVRHDLLKAGLAWTSEKNPLPELEDIRATAQAKRKGLWKQNDPTPPWIFRREQSMMEAKSR